MRYTVFSFSTTPKFAPQPPYLQHSRLPFLVMVLSVSFDPSLCIQVRWFTGWCVPCPHTSTELNSITFRICLRFPFFKVKHTIPLVGIWNWFTCEYQGYTLTLLRTTNEFDSFGLHSPLCSSTRSSRRIYSRSSMASASFVWLHNMHLPMCRTSSPTYLEVRIAMKASGCSVWVSTGNTLDPR